MVSSVRAVEAMRWSRENGATTDCSASIVCSALCAWASSLPCSQGLDQCDLRGEQVEPPRMVVGDWLVAIEAERHRNCQIPPDLVVKSQVIDIVEAIGGPISGETSSKGRVATGTQGRSWSQPPRLRGLPLNPMEGGKFAGRY